MVSLNYSLTKEDYLNYYVYVVWDSAANRKKRMLYYVKQFIPILFFVLAFYYTNLLDRPSRFVIMIVAAIFITSLLALIGVRSTIRKQAERVADNPDNSSIFLELTLTVSEAGIQVKNEHLEGKYQWNAFIKKLESEHYYFLFHNAIQAIIIPKRVFSSADEKDQFEKLLTQYLSFDADVSHLLKS